MFTTHQKGEIGRLKVATRATELGYIVSVPTMESRYDLVIDDGEKLNRVQVKYADYGGSASENAVVVKLKTECRNNGVMKTYKRGEIDAIIAYLPKTGKCYWLGPDQFEGLKSLTLRLEPSKNGQTKGIWDAKKFEW